MQWTFSRIAVGLNWVFANWNRFKLVEPHKQVFAGKSELCDVPSDQAMTLSLSMTSPDWSRKRSGRNCCGCCQSPGSMCALYRFTITCTSSNCYCTGLKTLVYSSCEVTWVSESAYRWLCGYEIAANFRVSHRTTRSHGTHRLVTQHFKNRRLDIRQSITIQKPMNSWLYI